MFGSFTAYAEWIELETFFSAFFLLFSLYWLYFRKPGQTGLAYALVATLYWGLQFKNYYPDYDLSKIISSIQYPVLRIWAVMALLFWVPAVRKKPLLLVLHSIVFFILPVIKYFDHNTPKILAASFLINSSSLILILLLTKIRKHAVPLKRSS